MLDWLLKNKEWVFSGIGALIIGLIGTFFKPLFKLGQPTDDTVTRNPVVAQSPAVTQTPSISQAPVVNITNNVIPNEPPKTPAFTPHPTNQAPLFALNPIAGKRDLMVVTGSIGDEEAEVCLARFKMHDGTIGWIPDRFEVSINYVERLSASGFPYDHPAGHVNQARWLEVNNQVHELILIMRRGSLLYAVNGLEDYDGHFEGDGSLIQLDNISSRPFVTATLTDTTNGQRWRAEFVIESNINGALTVRQTEGLRRA